MKRTIDVDYWHGDRVYLIASTEDSGPGIVNGVAVNPGGGILYRVMWADRCEGYHYGVELTAEKNYQS
jgi:hypothetical protein